MIATRQKRSSLHSLFDLFFFCYFVCLFSHSMSQPSFKELLEELVITFEQCTPQRDTHRLWNSNFGVCIQTAAVLWRLLRESGAFECKHLLWALHFLKTYNTYEQCVLVWGCTEKTLKRRIWEVLAYLFKRLNLVRSFPT
jgi:hypothetical protein